MPHPNDLRSAFAQALVHVVELELNGDVPGAIGALEDFGKQHWAEDGDEWLESAIAFQKASMLRDSGDLGGALKLFRSVQAKPSDRMFHTLTGYCIATVLDRLGRPREALDELAIRLELAEGNTTRDDLGSLTLYVDLAESLAEEIPDHVRDAIKEVVIQWGVECAELKKGDNRQLRTVLASANENLRKSAEER